MRKLITLTFTAALLLSCGQSTPREQNEKRTNPASEKPAALPESPGPKGPLDIALKPLEKRVFRPGDKIQFEVNLTNRAQEPILACVEDWKVHTGLVSFRVYDRDRKEVPVQRAFHRDYYADEKSDLALLKPGERRSGVLDLIPGGTIYPFKTGTYYVVARYYCPFDGKREVGGRNVVIVGDTQDSIPVEIEVDYRR